MRNTSALFCWISGHHLHAATMLILRDMFSRLHNINPVNMSAIQTYTTCFGLVIMPSRNGNPVGITGPLSGESTVHRWIPASRGQLCGTLMFLSFWPEQGVDLRYHGVHMSLWQKRCDINGRPSPFFITIAVKHCVSKDSGNKITCTDAINQHFFRLTTTQNIKAPPLWKQNPPMTVGIHPSMSNGFPNKGH